METTATAPAKFLRILPGLWMLAGRHCATDISIIRESDDILWTIRNGEQFVSHAATLKEAKAIALAAA